MRESLEAEHDQEKDFAEGKSVAVESLSAFWQRMKEEVRRLKKEEQA